MIKLVVCDFDGTLMPYGTQAVSKSIKTKLEYLLSQNVSVAVSSGRTYKELLHYLPEFGDMIYFICCDGAHYIKNGKSLYERQIESSDINRVFLQCNTDFGAILHGTNNNYSFGVIPYEAKRFEALPVKTPNDINEKIFKISLYSDEIKLPLYSGVRLHWDGGQNAAKQYVNRFSDKGTALSDLQTRLMLSKFDTVCIGDSDNDISMMRNAKFSFSVGNRSQKLISVTDKNVVSAEEAIDFCVFECKNNTKQHLFLPKTQKS